MARALILALALAAGLLAAPGREAAAAVAVDDGITARLVEGPRGTYRVILNFARLTRNDTIAPPLRRADLRFVRQSDGIRRLELVGGRNLLQRDVVVTLTNSFARRVIRSGGETRFAYRIQDSCRSRACGGPGLARAIVSLNLLSPN
jgi:hypothetical protein